MCRGDDGVEKWIAASLSFKCTYSLSLRQAAANSQQPFLNTGGSHLGQPAVFQGFSFFFFFFYNTQLHELCVAPCTDVQLSCKHICIHIR